MKELEPLGNMFWSIYQTTEGPIDALSNVVHDDVGDIIWDDVAISLNRGVIIQKIGEELGAE